MSNDKRKIKIGMLDDGRCRIRYGNDAGGRYVNVPYDEVRDFITGRRPRAELISLYFGEEKGTK